MILLVMLLAVNFGLVAMAVTRPVRRTSAVPPVDVPVAAASPSPMHLPVPETTENAEPSLPLLVAAPADAIVEVAATAPAVPWEDAEREAHVIPEPAELDAPVAAPVQVADSKGIAIASVAPTVEAPADPPPAAPDDVPQAAASPAPTALPRNVLFLMNPPNSGGVIHYAIEDVVVSLQPGEYQQLDDVRERRIRFHKGDDFGEVEHRLQRGTHLFAVGEMGWELRPADDNLARRLLNTCRPLAAEK
jgi:hypothetical protein